MNFEYKKTHQTELVRCIEHKSSSFSKSMINKSRRPIMSYGDSTIYIVGIDFEIQWSNVVEDFNRANFI